MNTSKITVLAASLLALVSTASAQMSMNNVTISGYVVGSYQYEKANKAVSNDSLFKGAGATTGQFLSNGDAARIDFGAKFDKVTGNVSLYYVPNLAPNEIGILDAYVTVNLDSGWAVTAGKFYGPFGYEDFNAPKMNAITYGNGVASLVPANDNIGVRLDYKDKDWSANVAVLDSLYNTLGNTFAIQDADSELKDTKAVDLSFTYNPSKDLTLFAAYGHQGKSSKLGATTDSTKKAISLYDVWASYDISSDLTGALEYVYSTNAADSGKYGSQWLATVNYKWSKEISAAVRVGYDVHIGGASVNGTQYTFAPAYKVNDHFTVRGEVSHFSQAKKASDMYYGLQGVFTF